MSNINIKWGCIQPLTGGMYIGARNAIGHDAEWIISYKGLDEVKHKKDGSVGAVGNEYNLFKWFEKQNITVPYYKFNHKMFDYLDNDKVEIEGGTPSYENIDLVVAVPVCSGLSQATIADDDTKKARNCNMEFISRYTLGVIQPKVYIFENAPILYAGNAGEPVREELNSIANEYGYSLIYYKTDTKFHDNCQRRPRTFVIFVKHNGDKTAAPDMLYEHITTSIPEFFARIPKDATQQETLTIGEDLKIVWDYVKQHYGPNYRTVAKQWTMQNIIDEDLWDDFYKYLEKYDTTAAIKNKIYKLFGHIQYKLSLGKNFYCSEPFVTLPTDKTIGACMFKTIPTTIHYNEERLYNIREWLTMMGMPFDFELYGDIATNAAKIGQNVPVRTAQWIVSEAVRIIENWDNIEREGDNIKFFNNTKVAK